MQSVAASIVRESERLSQKKEENGKLNRNGFVKPIDNKIKNQLSFIGEDNTSNVSAVENLIEMSKNAKTHYVYYGYENEDNNFKKDLEEILPGINIRIIGPPTIDQYNEIFTQREKDKDEFWMLQAINKNYWGLQSATTELIKDLDKENRAKPDRMFPRTSVFHNFAPSHTRWFIRQIRALRAEQLLGLVTILDDAMNNTSVIMLIEVGDKKLLFPGDAQIENWEYVLNKQRDNAEEETKRQELLEALKEVTFYKVGHHGSRNATPKTLWNNFKKKSTNKKNENRLTSIVSTLEGKHGETVETAVPRESLVMELEKHSEYFSTQNITTDFKSNAEIPDGDKGLYFDIEL
jgi:hypothetical protein